MCFHSTAHSGLAIQACRSVGQAQLVHLQCILLSICVQQGLLPLLPQFPCSLYLRTFGATNHEVKTTADGQLETIRPIEGRFYRFNLVQHTPQDQGQLVVTEIDPTQPDAGRLELQLLDPGAGDACGSWGNELPVRLRQMHSHWFDRCVAQVG